MNNLTRHYPGTNDTSTDSHIQHLQLSVNGYNAPYLKAGEGPAIVLLHGGASYSSDWIETMYALSSSYSLYAPDMPGYGPKVNPRGSYYLSDFVGFTLEFIQKLGLNSFVLVGHSLGGRVCLEISLRCPDMVHQLVLIDTVGFGKLTWWGRSLGAMAWGIRNILRKPQPYPSLLIEDGEDKDWVCLEKLPDIHIPTLVIWNRYDPYYPLTCAFKAKKLMPAARLEIFSGYGHAPHMQKRDYFNRLLIDFLGHA